MLRERLYGHKHSRQDSTRHLCLAIQKYGWEAFAAKELENCENNLLDEREIYYIQLYEADNPKKGYNMTRGGNANRKQEGITRGKFKGWKILQTRKPANCAAEEVRVI